MFQVFSGYYVGTYDTRQVHNPYVYVIIILLIDIGRYAHFMGLVIIANWSDVQNIICTFVFTYACKTLFMIIHHWVPEG